MFWNALCKNACQWSQINTDAITQKYNYLILLFTELQYTTLSYNCDTLMLTT